jgi:hypothetical protein
MILFRQQKEKKGSVTMRKEYRFPPQVWLALLFLGLGFSACSSAPTTDQSITQAIQAKYYSDPQLKNESIQIEVSNGEVTLLGEVSSDSLRQKAMELASAAPGVKNVNDSMQVKGVEAPPARAKSRAAESTPPPEPSKPAAPPPEVVTVPAGEEIRVQMIDSIDSKSSQPGSSFQASLYAPVTVGNKVVVPKGTNVYVKLINAKSAGRIKGSSELEVALDRLEFQGRSIALSSSTVKESGDSRGKQTAKRTVVGGGLGALVGGLAGGGKGAAIGAGIGAGGAVAVQALTHGKEVKIPAETKLDFALAEPFEVTIQAGKGQ